FFPGDPADGPRTVRDRDKAESCAGDYFFYWQFLGSMPPWHRRFPMKWPFNWILFPWRLGIPRKSTHSNSQRQNRKSSPRKTRPISYTLPHPPTWNTYRATTARG